MCSKKLKGPCFTYLIFVISFLLVNFKVNACGLLQEWPNKDTLRHYGLSEIQIEHIKNSLDLLLKVKDSLSMEKDKEHTYLTKLIDADEVDEIKIKKSVERLGELWSEILINDVKFILKMREELPHDLYKTIRRLFKLGNPENWRNVLKKKDGKK